MGPENTGRTQIENRVEAREGWPRGLACLYQNSGVLHGECWQECEMGGHEGCYRGANRLRVGAEWCLEKAPNLPPNFIGSKKGRAGMESGVKQNVPDSAGSACIIESEGLPVPLPGLGATRPEEGRGGLGSYVRSQEARSGRQKEERFPPMGIWGWVGDEDSFCQRRYLWRQDSAKGR